MKILLAIDGSSFSDCAIEEVAQRTWPSATEVKVFTVLERPILPAAEPWTLPDNYFEELERASEEHAKTTIERAVSRLKSRKADSLKITSTIVEGHPRYAIVEEADRWGADLIVVGSHGYRGLTRLWLGSVSKAVATEAKCSVEIVRKRENPKAA
jgi:nucleotide-binding universal stress UspA family protein